jgi:hypothetical protein
MVNYFGIIVVGGGTGGGRSSGEIGWTVGSLGFRRAAGAGAVVGGVVVIILEFIPAK